VQSLDHWQARDCMPAKQWLGQHSPVWPLPGHPDAVRLRTLLQLAAGWHAQHQQRQGHTPTGACRVHQQIGTAFSCSCITGVHQCALAACLS
jgi:hypothetical protein